MAAKTINFKKVDAWVVSLGQTYKALPGIPVGAKEFIVKITPWLALVFGLLSLIAWGLFSLIDLFVSPFFIIAGPVFLIKDIIIALIALIQGILMVMAFGKTRKRQVAGWKLLTYVAILGVLSSVVPLSVSSILGGLIGAAIEFYFLFQIKSYYK